MMKGCVKFLMRPFKLHPIMKEAFVKLHLSILIAGGTGIFGRLITLNEALLVWYRMMLATLMFAVLLALWKKEAESKRDTLNLPIFSFRLVPCCH